MTSVVTGAGADADRRPPLSWARRVSLGFAVAMLVVVSAATVGLPLAGTTRAGAVTADPAVQSYALVNVVGDVSTFGGAHYAGDRYDEPLNKPVVGAGTTPDRGGYWLVASDGGVFSYGDAGFHGSTGDLRLNQPVVGMASSADGGGYWLVASDGGVFSFGDARFFGSTGGIHLNRPIVGMAATADGGGYWLVASDGGVFSFGDARFFGSTGGLTLASPVTAMVTTPGGGGYLLVAGDGGVFTFGDARFSGSATSDLHPPDYSAAFSSTPPPTVTGVYLAPGPEPSTTGPTRVLLSGDSLSVQTAQGWTAVQQDYGAWVQNGGIMGCGVGVTGATQMSPWSSPDTAGPPWAACMNWQQRLHSELALSHPDVVVVLAGYWESQVWLYGDQWVTLRSPSFRAQVAGQLAALSALVQSYGAKLVFLSAPYYDNGTPNDIVDVFNSLIAQVPGAQVLDLHGLLDPANTYAQTVDGIVARDSDGIHLSGGGVAGVLAPALFPQVVAIGNQAR